MRLFVTGVDCVGKTTIGRRAAQLMGLTFFDLDHEVETFFNTSIERLQGRFLGPHSYGNEAAKALVHLLARPESQHGVIAQGLPVLPRAELPRLGPILTRDAHLLLGPAVLLYFLFEGRSPLFAGFWALIVAVLTSWRRRKTRIGPRAAFLILVESAQNALPVALACATVGIVVGVVSLSGLGLKLARRRWSSSACPSSSLTCSSSTSASSPI